MGWREDRGERNRAAADFLPTDTLAWVGPRICFLPGTVSALTAGQWVDFGAQRQIGSWGVDDLCTVLRSHTLMVMAPNF